MRPDDRPLEERIADFCIRQNLTISTAESCTGGLIAARLINAPGISAVYKEGFVTYSNEAKTKRLGVPEATLARFGAVSPQTAMLMAEGCARAAETVCSICSTGIAGPDGGTPEKPVGLVYLAVRIDPEVTVREYRFDGSREEIRQAAAKEALALFWEMLHQ